MARAGPIGLSRIRPPDDAVVASICRLIVSSREAYRDDLVSALYVYRRFCPDIGDTHDTQSMQGRLEKANLAPAPPAKARTGNQAAARTRRPVR